MNHNIPSDSHDLLASRDAAPRDWVGLAASPDGHERQLTPRLKQSTHFASPSFALFCKSFINLNFSSVSQNLRLSVHVGHRQG